MSRKWSPTTVLLISGEVDKMKICYDPKFEVITQRLTEEIAINYAPDGSVVGIEILDASKYLLKHKRPQVELENLQPA